MLESTHSSTHQALCAVDAALCAGNRELALAIAQKACSQGAQHFVLLTLAAQRELARGRAQRAVALALKARSMSAGNCEVLNTLGVAYVASGQSREACAVFEAALRVSPGAWPVRFNLAATLEELQQFARARIEFERVLEQQPLHAGTMARLASLAMQCGDIAECRRHAGQALRIDPAQRAAELALAEADIADGDYETARARIARCAFLADSDLKQRAVAESLTGDALDGLGRTDEAFDMYLRAKQTFAMLANSHPDDLRRESGANLVARLTNYFEHAPTDRWHVGEGRNAATSSAAHVFIVGFPRSGTTLLGQVLAGHPDAEVMDERSCLTSAQESFTIPPNGLDRLMGLGDGELGFWRDDYWRRVAEERCKPDRRLFVDKMPFYCVFLCLFAKLFPEARVLFVIRDPRDVVLSCLRKRFVMTEQMRELSSIESAAAHYNAVMSLCDIYRRKLGLRICDVRHEDLVGSFETETRRICAFVDLEWQPGLEDFARRAAQHPVGTPSGPQLARGPLADRQGQWRRYRSQLEPVIPRLVPWIERFGYERE